MADGDLAGADPASNDGDSQVWLFANSMYRLNRIVQEVHLPSMSAASLASRPAMIARRRLSGHFPHYCREGSGRSSSRFRLWRFANYTCTERMAVRKLVLYFFMLYCIREAGSVQCLTLPTSQPVVGRHSRVFDRPILYLMCSSGAAVVDSAALSHIVLTTCSQTHAMLHVLYVAYLYA